MPLLMCPNDNASMQTLSRNGVEFDMCPTCRGVWLDRGELEKLMQGARDGFGGEAPQDAAMAPQQPQQRPPRQQHGERGEYGEHGERGEQGFGQQGQRRRRGGFDLFDIFD
jgi:Zn-finger nucleic acid-binding protein